TARRANVALREESRWRCRHVRFCRSDKQPCLSLHRSDKQPCLSLHRSDKQGCLSLRLDKLCEPVRERGISLEVPACPSTPNVCRQSSWPRWKPPGQSSGPPSSIGSARRTSTCAVASRRCCRHSATRPAFSIGRRSLPGRLANWSARV